MKGCKVLTFRAYALCCAILLNSFYCAANDAGISNLDADGINHDNPQSAATAASSHPYSSDFAAVEPVKKGSWQDSLSPIALSSNLLYDLALVPEIAARLNLGCPVSISADWMGAWWSNHDARRYYRIYGSTVDLSYRVSPEVRHNPFAGHHIGIYVSLTSFDIQFGRKHDGLQSDKFIYAAGISYTYSMPIARRLSLDFSIGIGYMQGTYKKLRSIDDHNVWKSTHHLRWIGPTRAGVSLVWLLGTDTFNAGKGGKK